MLSIFQIIMDSFVMAINFAIEVIRGGFGVATSLNAQAKAQKVEYALKAIPYVSDKVIERMVYIEAHLSNNTITSSLIRKEAGIFTQMVNAITDIEDFTNTLRNDLQSLNHDSLHAAIEVYAQMSLQSGIMNMIEQTENTKKLINKYLVMSLPKIKILQQSSDVEAVSELIKRTEHALPNFLEVIISGKTFFQHAFGIQDKQLVQQEVIMGDSININTNNSQGIIINLKSRLENVQQNINLTGNQNAADRTELKALVEELFKLLNKVPKEQSDAAEVVAKRVETAVEETSKPKPDKEIIVFSLESLKKAAANLALVIPDILPIATRIAEHITKTIA